MRRATLLWILALLLTLASAVWQRLTGPSHPVRVRTEVGAAILTGRLLRSHETGSALPVRLHVEGAKSAQSAQSARSPGDGGDNGSPSGTLVWRRFPTADPWQRQPLVVAGDELVGEIPPQPPAGKVEYWVELQAADAAVRVPAQEAAVARFTGSVPMVVLGAHILVMFVGMLLSLRAGLEGLARGPALRRQAWVTLGLLVVGGLILGPVVQKHAFGAYWTGWPLGEDLTDNKLAVAVLAWALAVWRLRGYRSVDPRGRGWALAAALVVLAVYLIPHSLHGSTLDYSTMEQIQG